MFSQTQVKIKFKIWVPQNLRLCDIGWRKQKISSLINNAIMRRAKQNIEIVCIRRIIQVLHWWKYNTEVT